MRRNNTQFAIWGILLLVGMVPLLWGGNRPLVWYATGMSGGLIGTLVALSIIRSGGRLHLGVSRDPALLWLILLIPTLTGGLTLAGLLLPDLTGNISPGGSLIALVRITGPLLLGLMTYHLLSERNGRRTFGVRLLAISLAHALYGLVILRSPELALIPNPFYPDSLTAGFINRNSAASFLGFGVCLALAGLLSEPDRRGSGVDRAQRRALFALASLLLVVALLMTRSRMGVAATGAGAALIAILHLISTRGPGRRTAWFILGAIPSGLAVFVYQAIDRVETLGQNLTDRLALYQEVLGMIRQAPLFGVGPGNFELGFRAFSGEMSDPGLRWEDAHNTLLEGWAESGLLIGSLPAIVLLVILFRLIRLARGAGDRFLPLAASGAVLLSLLHGLVDFPLEMQGNLLFLSVLVGAALSGTRTGVRA
jgi:O-antigen ligase